MALVGLSLAACSEDNLDTNQYKGGVSLNAYGPNPVMRGGTLRFVGSNLDQIASIQIPGVAPITNYESVKSGIPSEIRVTVPKDGPTEGVITLTTKDSKTIQTQSALTYTEPIEFESFSPASAMPGDVVTIKGDYLNLIYSLAFAEKVIIGEKDFLTHDRYTITVAVPDEAKTGKIELYTADLTVSSDDELDYQIIQSETAIEIGVPTISKLKGRNEAEAQGNITAKAGEQVTITGTYFNMVEEITVGGFKVTDMAMAEDGTALKFNLPAEAPDGDIMLICKSGVEVPAGTLTTVKPTECVASPSPVKAGKYIQIDGKDIDLVFDIEFADANGEYTLNNNQNHINTMQAYATIVPMEAIEGNLKLVMANGSRIDVAFTLVKPTVTGYNVNPVSAGGAIQISGTDLDLIKSIDFGDGQAIVEKDNVSADGTTITVTIPMEATSGKPKFNLANGTSVEGPELAINEAVFCYITEMPEFNDETTPEAGDVFTVPVKNADKLTNVYVNGTEVKYVLSEKNNRLTFGIPTDATATSVLKLLSSNGEIEYEITVKPATSVSKLIFQGPQSTGNWTNNLTVPADAFLDLPEGEVTMVISYMVEKEGARVKFNDGHWANIKLAGCVGETEYFFEFDSSKTKAEIPLSPADIAHLSDPSILDWGGSMFINGHDVTINKIELVIELPQDKDLAKYVKNMDGTDIAYPYAFTWDDTGRFSLSQDLLLNELKVKKGSKFLVYKAASNTGQVQINNSSWKAIYTIADWNGTEDVLVQEFDDALMDAVNNGGLVIQGDLKGISKVAILP